MAKQNLPDFPLLFERVARFLHEVKPISPKQEKHRKMAIEALDTIGYTIYPAIGICNGRPRSKPLK